MVTLRERHNLKNPMKMNINDVVMIKGDEKNWGKWKIVIIKNTSIGKVKCNQINQNMYREEHYWKANSAVASNGFTLLHPMGLHCGSKTTTSNNQNDKKLNVNTEEFRPKRSAAKVAEHWIRDITDDEN